MAEFNVQLTKKGADLLAKALSGQEMRFTRIVMGDADYSKDIYDVVNVISPKKSLPIVRMTLGEGRATVRSVLKFKEVAVGFHWREIGLYAKDMLTETEILYAYGNARDKGDYIPSGDSSTLDEKNINITAIISNAEAVTAVIDETLAFVTQKDLDFKVDKVNGKQLSSNDYTAAEKTKLSGIAVGANNYVHPASHPASVITQDAAKRFVSDAEKATWNGKADKSAITTFNATATHESVVNLYGNSFGKASSYILFDATEMGNGYIKVVFDGTQKDNIHSKQLASSILRPNKKYTIVTDVLSNTNASKSNGLVISSSDWSLGAYVETIAIGQSQQTGIIKSLLTTENSISEIAKAIKLMSGVGATGEIVFRQMLLEGDWTNKELPCDYWEDTYNAYNLDILNKPSKLPENYQVTFTAPTNYTAGDKIKINGVEHLVNLYERGFNNPKEWYALYKNTERLSAGYAKFIPYVDTTSFSEITNISSNTSKIVKPSTIYTSVLDVLENTFDAGDFRSPRSAEFLAFTTVGVIVPCREIGIYKKSIVSVDGSVSGRVAMRAALSGDSTTGHIIARAMLVEGDYTNKDLPADYWENTYGVYDILGYGDGNALSDATFMAGQTVTLTVGVSGAYLANNTYTNPNLLENGNFAYGFENELNNELNYVKNLYGWSMSWKSVTSDVLKIVKTEKGLKLTKTGSGHANFSAIIRSDLIKSLAGQTVTVTYKYVNPINLDNVQQQYVTYYSDGVKVNQSPQPTSKLQDKYVTTFTVPTNTDLTAFGLGVQLSAKDGATCELQYIKLELGNKSTHEPCCSVPVTQFSTTDNLTIECEPSQLQTVINNLPKEINHGVYIRVLDGVNTNTVTVAGFHGSGTLSIAAKNIPENLNDDRKVTLKKINYNWNNIPFTTFQGFNFRSPDDCVQINQANSSYFFITKCHFNAGVTTTPTASMRGVFAHNNNGAYILLSFSKFFYLQEAMRIGSGTLCDISDIQISNCPIGIYSVFGYVMERTTTQFTSCATPYKSIAGGIIVNYNKPIISNRLYTMSNITCSQTAPTTVLPENYIHMTY